jgi:hypothetical protein
MFDFLKNFFKSPNLEELASTPGSGVIKDPDFGFISYELPYKTGGEGFWQMYNDWDHPESNAKIGCSAIPGDENGPFKEARQFLLSKRNDLDALWDLCCDELIKIIAVWYPEEKGRDPKEVYYLSSLSMENSNSDEWEVSFEAKDDYFWTFISFQIKGNTIIGNTTDT